MKRARRRSAESVGQQSDVSYSDNEDYKPRSGSLATGERGSSGDRQKAELRRLKNREAARRVRERKSNQLNTYKSQVDELKRENQKLLQIIAQLQNTSIACISAPLATTTSTLGPDAEADGPAATASCLSAGVPPGSIDSGGGPSGVRSADAGALGSASLLVQAEPAPPAAPAAAGRQQQQPRLLASTTSCPPGAPAGAAAVAAGGPDGNASGSCIVSQPVNTSALLSSSTQQMLSGCHSAPHGLLQPTSSAPPAFKNQVLLQRACGCTGDAECEECEGVRVTLSSASNLPLVTTPGPRPKLLTLEDLNLAGLSRAASLHTSSLMSAPQLLPTRVSGSSFVRDDAAAAAAAGRSVDGAADLRHQQQQHHRLGQITEKQQGDESGGMLVDFVGTLEPTSRSGAAHGTRLDSHSSSGHAVFGSGAEARPGSYSESCYVRKSNSRSTRQRSNPPEPSAAPHQQGVAEDAAAAGASGSGFASGSAIQQQQLVGSFSSPGSTAAPPADAAAAADVIMQGPGAVGFDAAAAAAPPTAALAWGSNSGMLEPAVVGSNSSMMRPGSLTKAEQQQQYEQAMAAVAAAASLDGSGSILAASGSLLAASGSNAGGSGSMLAPMAAVPAAAAAAAGYGMMAAAPQQQHKQHGAHGHKSSKPGHKLMRSIAAAVNGFVRSGRRDSASSTGANTPRGATAVLLQQQEEQLAARSMSASMLGSGIMQNAQMLGMGSGLGAASFTAGAGSNAAAAAAAAAVLQQQQQAMMLVSSGMLASGYSSGGALSLQQQQGLLGSIPQGFSSGEFSSGANFQQQQQAQSDDDAIIMAAQLMLAHKHQQRVSSPRAAAAAAAAAVAGSGQQKLGGNLNSGALLAAQQQLANGGGIRRPSPVAMDTTPMGWAGQASPRLALQQQQQQPVFPPEQLSQPYAAAVLPLDFQATYTDVCVEDAEACLAEGCLADDVVMQLARQEGVLIDDPENAFF